MSYPIPNNLKGLTEEEVLQSRTKFGNNKIATIENGKWYILLFHILKEPMLLLLISVTIIYLIVGDYGEAAFMFVAILAVTGIEVFQDNRSKKALEELEKLNEPLSSVIRNARVEKIPTSEIVVGDLYIVEEGNLINADGRIIHSNDFSVNESSLTGESFSVFKDKDVENNTVFSGTIVVSGLAIVEVETIGIATYIGKIGAFIQNIKEEKSPLQIQIAVFVKAMAVIGIIIFLLVWGYSFYQSRNLIDSLLNGLTLAMSILPEEIPVAFTTFMALGAWKLMRDGIIIKRSSIVETLGSTTVICTDKTGTITENNMHLQHLYQYATDTVYGDDSFGNADLSELIEYAMWSSEPVPFDPMEKALHQVYATHIQKDVRPNFQMTHEYPLAGKPPMMTHIFENANKDRIIAAKGAAEAIIKKSNLSESESNKLLQLVKSFGSKGYRVLAVAKTSFEGDDFPVHQEEFIFEFLGLTVFYDPPKNGISKVVQQIYNAGIELKVITGDNADTTNAIALQSGIINHYPIVNGSEIADLQNMDLQTLVKKTSIFTRMFPEAKLAVVNALKKEGEVVAMLGDGVNDAPALKSAHIGVAMGTKGTEIAKAAASLVITNDDLGKLITGIAAGRRIYSNLKKAVQYIISIHIPIIFTVSIPLFLGWIYPQIFTPVHVIFLELVMGPTCSIVFENEPMEKNAMRQAPRKMSETFLNWRELSISIIQGIIITIAVLFAYQWMVKQGGNEEQTRAMVFSTLIFANVFLSFVNRSFFYSVFESMKNKNPLLIGITVIVLMLLILILNVKPIAAFFHLQSLSLYELGTAVLIASIAVFWFEGFKWLKRKKIS